MDLHTLRHPSTSASRLFELFDCLLKPKLLYGCEIWGNRSCKSLELYHTRFIKKTLDVKSTTNASMIYAQTGRFPLAIDINVQIIKYWLKILRMESNSYVKLVYMYNEMLVHDERKFIKHFEQRCRDKTVLMIFKAVHIAGYIKKLNKHISLKRI